MTRSNGGVVEIDIHTGVLCASNEVTKDAVKPWPESVTTYTRDQHAKRERERERKREREREKLRCDKEVKRENVHPIRTVYN